MYDLTCEKSDFKKSILYSSTCLFWTEGEIYNRDYKNQRYAVTYIQEIQMERAKWKKLRRWGHRHNLQMTTN